MCFGGACDAVSSLQNGVEKRERRMEWRNMQKQREAVEVL